MQIWIEHWINDLVSQETIQKFPYFEEWMDCPDRYTEQELYIMSSIWELRYVCS